MGEPFFELLDATDRASGTIVRIFFPLVDTEDSDGLEESSAPSVETFAPATREILVVDDEQAVRRYVENVLSRNGYQVVTAPNAGEAFLLCEDQPDRFELVLTDIVMPRVDGVRLHSRLQEMETPPKIAFMSGFPRTSEADIPQDFKLIEKPFDPQALLGFVADIIEES